MDNWEVYAVVLMVVLLAFYMFKKVAGCLLKTIVTLLGLAALGIGYWFWTSVS